MIVYPFVERVASVEHLIEIVGFLHINTMQGIEKALYIGGYMQCRRLCYVDTDLISHTYVRSIFECVHTGLSDGPPVYILLIPTHQDYDETVL